MYRTGRESTLDRGEAAGVPALAALVMSRKPIMTRRLRRHEDHVNHEAWAIPYGDLITLLLAFFVVMYAISSVNAGKYRVLSDALVAAFQGTPRSPAPVQVGDKQPRSDTDTKGTAVQQPVVVAPPQAILNPIPLKNDLPQKTAGAAEALRAE